MMSSSQPATYVRIGQYRLSKTLGIGSFGKVKCETDGPIVPELDGPNVDADALCGNEQAVLQSDAHPLR